MTTPYQEALLAIEILVDALHDTGDTVASADAFAQVRHLGFDTWHTKDRKKPQGTWSESVKRPQKKLVHRSLFS